LCEDESTALILFASFGLVKPLCGGALNETKATNSEIPAKKQQQPTTTTTGHNNHH
jgi:hypothetical protein